MFTSLIGTHASAAPGDVLETLVINNTSGDGRAPMSYQGVVYHDGYIWVLDLFSDRIYRVYPSQVLDQDGITILHNPGDSDFNLPIPDTLTATPPCNSQATCKAGGSLTFADNFFWNASPLTDQIIKLDPVDGDNLETENTLNALPFPSPLGMTFDGTYFWIVDWQSNTINKVLPEDGSVLDVIPGPSTLPACGSVAYGSAVNCARPFGIAWDGFGLWVSEQEEDRIYRVNPADGSIITFFDTPGVEPQGLAWDGEFLWHTDRNDLLSSTLYKLDSGVIPFGIMGCVEKNGIGVNGDVLLSQNAEPDQSTTTDDDGCFVFPNFASGVPLSVNVSETGNDKKPVLSLVGGDVTLLVGDNYVDPGVLATDEEDGDISANVTAIPDVFNLPSLIDTSVPGPVEGVTITYNVIDSVGNAADPITRTVFVLEIDVIPPVITLNGDNPLYVEQASSYSEPGATALDTRDGDISGSVAVTGSVNPAVAGTYLLDYDVTDAAGNAATTVTRTVIVQDTTIPTIALLGANPLELQRGDAYTEPGATATDNIDGDISGSIAITGSVSTNVTGPYILTYNVADAAGNNAVTVTRTVNVTDTSAPVITLLGAATFPVELNTPYVEPGYTALDAPSTDLTGSVVVSGSVDTSIAGSYTLNYDVTDVDGNAATTITRTVVVADTTAPVLTINGDNPLAQERGIAYVEAGATAIDAVDGDISGSVVIGGDVVDFTTAGTYNVTYDITDSAGNAAATQTRIVNVGDTTPPLVTLIGAAVIEQEQNTPYVDQGATASDNIDGDISASIVVGGDTVDTTVAGDYTITYTVTDSSGNTSAVVTRLVQVADRTAPVITLLGSSPVDHEVDTVYTDAGASASDNIDGNISGLIGVTGSVNANVIGTYVLTYNIQDAAGNAATTVTRTVNVVDTGAPAITLVGANPVLHELQTPYVDQGATSSDAADGDLTGSIVATGTVDSNTAGTYTLSYDVIDSQSNAAPTVTRDVIVADRTAPVISLIGPSTIQVEQGGTYVDQGASAIDVIDGDISGSISVGGAVNPLAAGTYILTYNVSDAAGNAATPVSRTVNVVDTTIPVIALNGLATVDHEVNTVYTDAGATASDNIDGDISANISTNGSVDASTIGTYQINYNVSDSSGNAATTITRTINVADTGAPIISVLGANPLFQELNTAFVDPGATASDAADGNLTSSIVIVGDTVDTATAGTYTITYDVTDSQLNAAATQTRTVVVGDFTKPVITLRGSATTSHEQGTTYTDAGATASDNIDGDISGDIVVTGNVAVNSAGTYLLNFNVLDAAGNAADTVVRTVIVSDTTAPIIALTGSATVNVEQGTSYTDAGATASDNLDGNVTSNIVVSGDTVDPNTAGTYTIRYDVTDAAGNNATQVIRTVEVADTTPPLIVLGGNAIINQEQGTTYTDAGATANDIVDGPITVTVGGDIVNTAVAGTYTITYDATDAAGNSATQVVRTVIVADTTAPLITLTGASAIDVEQGTSYTEQGATASDLVDGVVTVVTGGDIVDANATGIYTVTYDAVDAAGNNAIQVTRTVTVADTTPPTLTLLGAATVNIEQNIDTFVDSGVDATDNIDGVIPAVNVVVSGDTVDETTAGTYVIQYDVNDAAGNAAAPVIRTVIVADTTAPIISVTGSAATIERGSAYVDAGATANDAVDGDLTASIATTNPVNNVVSGLYTVTYDVSDSAGNNATTAQRSVTVQDTTPPALALVGAANVNQEQGVTYTDAGATAIDLPGENISGAIVVSGTVDVNTAGAYVLTYNVDDVAGNAAVAVTRTVTVADTAPPIITLTGAATINVEQGTSYTEQGATANDSVDGAVVVTVGGDVVNAAVAGTYTVTYDAVDAAGNNAPQTTRTVIVADTTIPSISLSGDTDIDLPLGDLYAEPGFTASDNIDGDLTASVAVSGSIDINTEGTYVLSYDVTDAGGNAAITRTRTINVVNPVAISVEAETASIFGSHTVESTNVGFTGSGYIQHSGEGYVEYTFSAFAIPYDLTVRYAWDTGDRPLEVILNSQSLGTIPFPATGSLTTWLDTATFSLTPTSGVNTLRLQTTGSSGANLDSLTLTPQ